MSRDHRRFIADIRPSARSKTFTIREFARLTRDLSEQDLRVLSRNTKEADLAERLSELAGLVASQRAKRIRRRLPGMMTSLTPIGSHVLFTGALAPNSKTL